MKENQFAEFKNSFNDAVIETLVAFANTKGGKVYIGLDDHGIPSANFTLGKESLQQYLNEIKNKTQPSIIPDTEIKQIQGKEILELSIQEYPVKPVSCKGRYYKRISNANHQLTTIEIATMSMQSLHLSWDAYTVTGATFESLSLSKINKFVKRINFSGRFQLSGSSLENLTKLKLVQNTQITNAAVLLFSKKETSYNVHLGRFKTPSLIIDDKMLRGTLFEVVEEVMKYFFAQLKVAFEIKNNNTQRTEIFEYPIPALRELLLNALLHRDYLSPVDVQIKIFDQQISFYNPGKLFGNISIEDLLTNSYQSQTRNKLLAEAFYLTGDIEKYGSGFHRIKEEITHYPTMKFTYQEMGDGFLATLSYQTQKTNSLKSSEKSSEKGSEKSSEKIITFIKENPSVTIQEMANMLNLTTRSVEKQLDKLKKTAQLKRTGPAKGGYWEIL